MKILEIDYDFYYYPQGISSIDGFIDYANSKYNSFVKLIQLKTENCAFPYFIKVYHIRKGGTTVLFIF